MQRNNTYTDAEAEEEESVRWEQTLRYSTAIEKKIIVFFFFFFLLEFSFESIHVVPPIRHNTASASV